MPRVRKQKPVSTAVKDYGITYGDRFSSFCPSLDERERQIQYHDHIGNLLRRGDAYLDSGSIVTCPFGTEISLKYIVR